MSRFCYGSCEGWRHCGDPDRDERALATGHTNMWCGFPGQALRVQEVLKRDAVGGRLSASGQTQRSFEGHLARWAGSMPVYQKGSREGSLSGHRLLVNR